MVSMRTASAIGALLALAVPSMAFAPSSGFLQSRALHTISGQRLHFAKAPQVQKRLAVKMNAEGIDRRAALSRVAVATAGLISSTVSLPSIVLAEGAGKKVVVAGATGQTGRRILERLASTPGLNVVGGVRNVEKATKSLAESSTVVRGAMVQKVAAVDTAAVELKQLDVVADSVEAMAKTLEGADTLIIATGFIPGNPFQMNSEAHKVDNVGTIKLIDAAKKANVKKVVMVSSILTNGRAWGQEKSPGFVITNAFGGVLDEKLVAEKYLRTSGLDYTIVRPGGLKAKPATGALLVSKEDSLNSGEISRDLVADVAVASMSDAKVSFAQDFTYVSSSARRNASLLTAWYPVYVNLSHATGVQQSPGNHRGRRLPPQSFQWAQHVKQEIGLKAR